MKRATALAAVFLTVVPASLMAQADEKDIARIIDEGKNRNQVMLHLKKLTQIGPRVTSSPILHRAQNWAADNFKKWGLKNVHLEKWGDIPVGFERGKRQIGRMVSPTKRNFQFTTMNWMPGTEGLVKGPAVIAPKTMEEFAKVKDKLKSAFLLTDAKVDVRPAEMPNDDLKKAIDSVGIAGRVFASSDERVHSHGNWREKSFSKRPTDLNFYLRRSDWNAITAEITANKVPMLEFDAEVKWFEGPVPEYNVIADIPGTEKPDEMIIVCGHLDSWNSPGSQGACDNGTGSVTAMEAARILMKSGVKPKRTIRFILWSGEEQGLLGSRAYVEAHKADMPKISAVLNDDGGSGYQGGYQGVESMKAMMEAAFAPTVKAFPEFPMEFVTLKEMPTSGSSDHAPFNFAGVPGFFTMEKGPKADYGFVWHTQNDRYEYAVPEYLVQSSTNHAVVSFNLAQAPTLLARAPKPEGKQANLNLPAVGADRVYEDPDNHDHDHDHTDDWVLELRDRLRRQFEFLIVVARGR